MRQIIPLRQYTVSTDFTVNLVAGSNIEIRGLPGYDIELLRVWCTRDASDLFSIARRSTRLTTAGTKALLTPNPDCTDYAYPANAVITLNSVPTDGSQIAVTPLGGTTVNFIFHIAAGIPADDATHKYIDTTAASTAAKCAAAFRNRVGEVFNSAVMGNKRIESDVNLTTNVAVFADRVTGTNASFMVKSGGDSAGSITVELGHINYFTVSGPNGGGTLVAEKAQSRGIDAKMWVGDNWINPIRVHGMNEYLTIDVKTGAAAGEITVNFALLNP